MDVLFVRFLLAAGKGRRSDLPSLTIKACVISFLFWTSLPWAQYLQPTIFSTLLLTSHPLWQAVTARTRPHHPAPAFSNGDQEHSRYENLAKLWLNVGQFLTNFKFEKSEKVILCLQTFVFEVAFLHLILLMTIFDFCATIYSSIFGPNHTL